MNISTIIVAVDAGTIVAAIIPSALFLALIFYNTLWKGGGYTIKPVRTKLVAKVVGIATNTTNDTFIEDDLLLWKEFKRIRDKNLVSDKKENHSFVSVQMNKNKEAKTWEYLIGRIVTDFTDIPTGFKTIEIEPQSYLSVHLNVKNEESWGETVTKLEHHILTKWLPDSSYELKTDSAVKSIVYHDKRDKKNTRTIIYYLAVKEKPRPDETYA